MSSADIDPVRRSCDIAYTCYAFAGLVPILTDVVSHIPMGTGTAGGIGLLVLVPLAMAAIIAVVIGFRYTIRAWRHWPLLVCAGFSVLYVGVFLAEAGPAWLRTVLSFSYGVTMVGLSLRWFLFTRRAAPGATAE